MGDLKRKGKTMSPSSIISGIFSDDYVIVGVEMVNN